MSKFSATLGFILGAMLVIFFMSTAMSWVVYIVWQGVMGSAPPFWIFWSSCSMALIAACFASSVTHFAPKTRK